ncbi:diguanylate cyclase [Pseudanabaena sp. ABRG5-3]|uniref:GGDEF domain-containing response regulator n=1 Tax=Pseudanabaena sp. ABRG5-3 TaxID=685565 RepID=UPI000DC70559|nr:diguanylate cyclase [Pseudanabaena sp. ABRG5-3]BBC25267.1 response regulator receiver modulated diguanylate cyclase [Pseudanabaena sp. ABRG5-3]
MPEISESSLLIVDDDQMNRELLYRHLKNLGYDNITLADSGKRGLEIVDSQAIDLILLDMMMPVMNGLEMLDHLKSHQEWRVIPVIIISALDEKEMMLSCIQKGAEDYLIKPYDRVLLKARVRACLDKKMLHDREILHNQKLEAAYKELAIAYYELEIVKNELEALSHRDGLTGIANRRYFDTVLEREWNSAKREQKFLSLILFDVDYFKKYNDTYGHLAGDDCLCQIAIAASRVLKRPRDTLARYGGEEFAVILPDTDSIGASFCAEQIRFEIENLNIIHISSQINSYVTASLGIAAINPHVEFTTSQQLIKEADLALYQAKREGRNCVKVWSNNG